MRPFLFSLFALCSLSSYAQSKKPLDHTVYDAWQNIGERSISPDGQWIAYTIDVQEGDGTLYVTGPDTTYKVRAPRGYMAAFTGDSKFLVFRIKPLYQDIKQARIKKKKAEDGPKDSLGILELGHTDVLRIPRVRSYRLPDKDGDRVAYELEPSTAPKPKRPLAAADLFFTHNDAAADDAATAPRDAEATDGLSGDVETSAADFAEGDDASAEKKPEGVELVLRDLNTGHEEHWNGVGEYQIGRLGNILAFGVVGRPKDSVARRSFCVWHDDRTDTVYHGGYDFKKIAIDEAGKQVAFLADQDSLAALLHFFHLYYYHTGDDSALLLISRVTQGMKVGWTVSENGDLGFSRSGRMLLLGTAPVAPPRDTTIAETEVAHLDIWNYKDDYLQPMQLKNRDKEIKRSYLAVYDLERRVFTQLADIKMPSVLPSDEGDGPLYLGLTDYGKRIPLQWEGKTRKDVYAVDPHTGTATLVQKDVDGSPALSPLGHYIVWYDMKTRQYFTYSAQGGIRKISGGVHTALYDEQNDVPDDPDGYGIAGWTKDDASVWIYDRYDIWALDPGGRSGPVRLTAGRRAKDQYRYIALDRDEHAIDTRQPVWLDVFNDSTKVSGFAVLEGGALRQVLKGPFTVRRLVKAKHAAAFVFTRETFETPPGLWAGADPGAAVCIASTNPQQAQYNWGRARLVHWTTFQGKKSDGILYVPEDFDPHKRYPMITYFYERLSDDLYHYLQPSPTPSALNIPFYVSRGYLVFTPDIRYTVGHPGKSAYDYVVSGVKALCKNPYVDAANLGIQGQSWGGYQVAYLITATHLFKAAWAGAPVVNMFSAYGGIRWETGMNRQFQYEHTQSRIGATPWQRPDLYIENSPLFHLAGVTTPLVIMANDADGAVPWYQGIEMFTDMKRLGKQVWMLTYNGEAHNLVERRNRKDIQVREQQFFDWQLKGARPAHWLSDGVPATAKGRTWGLEMDGEGQ